MINISLYLADQLEGQTKMVANHALMMLIYHALPKMESGYDK